jgi:DNA (cytosine-5)-methyltransferase 1
MPTICSDSHGTPHAVTYSEQIPYTLKIRSGCEGGGKGALIQDDLSATLSTLNDQYLFQPMYAIDGDKLGKAEREGGSGLGVREGDKMYTLTAKDKHGVAYLASGKGTVGTLMANAGTKLWLGNQEAFSGDYHVIEEQHTPVQYIVRRLTPTECARLQGFPDWWAHPDKKDDFTDEEYAFWLNVRNNHAEINGKQTKDYTKAQMLTWYNKLHTDSSEYKLWGNGIALPNSLYVMQGIANVLKK